MGWHINEVHNDLHMTEEVGQKVAAQIFNGGNNSHGFEDVGDIVYWVSNKDAHKLYFNYDWMEHMDYLWDDEVIDVLTLNKVTGTIIFSSNDGDNSGEVWGYQFADGVFNKLNKKQSLKFLLDLEG